MAVIPHHAIACGGPTTPSHAAARFGNGASATAAKRGRHARPPHRPHRDPRHAYANANVWILHRRPLRAPTVTWGPQPVAVQRTPASAPKPTDSLAAAPTPTRLRMWMHLRARFQSVFIRVLHPGIRESNAVEILRGLPEGSRLSPTLFGIFVSDLINTLKKKFPNASVAWGGSSVWIGGILYVDDLCLISANPQERGIRESYSVTCHGNQDSLRLVPARAVACRA